MRKIFTLFFCAASLATGLAQQESYFTNPVIHLYRFGELAANRTCIRREAGMD